MGIQNTRDPLWMLMSTYGAMQSMVHVRKEEEEEISLTHIHRRTNLRLTFNQ